MLLPSVPRRAWPWPFSVPVSPRHRSFLCAKSRFAGGTSPHAVCAAPATDGFHHFGFRVSAEWTSHFLLAPSSLRLVVGSGQRRELIESGIQFEPRRSLVAMKIKLEAGHDFQAIPNPPMQQMDRRTPGSWRSFPNSLSSMSVFGGTDLAWSPV